MIIEIPAINFSKLVTKTHKPMTEVLEEERPKEEKAEKQQVYESENPEEIIDSLFVQEETVQTETIQKEHSVDPEDFALYKKYLS